MIVWVADAVALTTVTLQLLSAGIAPEPEPGDFWSGVGAGVESLLGALAVAAVGLGVALPWLLFLGAVALVLLLVLRRVLRRRTRHGGSSPDAAGAAAGPGPDGPDASPAERVPDRDRA